MKKQTKTHSKSKKLLLNKEKVRDLQKDDLEQTAGGALTSTTLHSITTCG